MILTPSQPRRLHYCLFNLSISELRSAVTSPTTARIDQLDGEGMAKKGKKPIDVFISYRRSNGSQLARSGTLSLMV